MDIIEIDKDVKKQFKLRWLNKMEKKLIITHKNCNDGKGVLIAMGLADLIDDNTTILELQYGFDEQMVKDAVKDKLVYTADFSFNLKLTNELNEISNGLVVVDHHLQALRDYKVNSPKFVHLDMSKSGALLTWEFFMGDTSTDSEAVEPSKIIRFISDRDLFNFTFGDHTRAATLYVRDNTWQSIVEDLKDYNEYALIKPYIKTVEYIENEYDLGSVNYNHYTIDGVKFAGKNNTWGASDILNRISLNSGLPSVGWFVNEAGDFIFSLREYDSKNGVDVSLISKSFGGGGHRAASGFRIKKDELDLVAFFHHNIIQTI